MSSWGIGELTWLVARSCHATMDVRMAQTGRPKAALVLTEEERETLAGWARRPSSPQSLALLRQLANRGRGEDGS